MSFLDMDDVIKTCLLSKRWRYVWTCIPCLDFNCFWGMNQWVRTFIDRAIFNHEGPKIEKLSICQEFWKDSWAGEQGKCLTLQLDSWVRFAVRRNVEEVSLDFSECDTLGSVCPPYRMPHSIFSCCSLTSLRLGFCDLNLPASMHLSSLKTLTLEFVQLSKNWIKRLTSSSPLLEELSLSTCSTYEDLNIVIENRNLKLLKISEYHYTNGKIIISAPYLVSLEFSLCLPRTRYHVKNLSSLLNASFCLDEDEMSCNPYEEDEYFYELWVRLLGDLHHVKKLRLCWFYIQVLSIWRVQWSDSFAISATCVDLDANLNKLDLPGISYVLRNSSKLETLIVNQMSGECTSLSEDLEDKFDSEEKSFWETEEFDFSQQLQNLKTVEIRLREVTVSEFDAVLDILGNVIEFVKFLLKNSMVLERVTLSAGKQDSIACNRNELLKLTEKLTPLPRASPNAEILII